jgi:hypothetical protein
MPDITKGVFQATLWLDQEYQTEGWFQWYSEHSKIPTAVVSRQDKTGTTMYSVWRSCGSQTSKNQKWRPEVYNVLKEANGFTKHRESK